MSKKQFIYVLTPANLKFKIRHSSLFYIYVNEKKNRLASSHLPLLLLKIIFKHLQNTVLHKCRNWLIKFLSRKKRRKLGNGSPTFVVLFSKSLSISPTWHFCYSIKQKIIITVSLFFPAKLYCFHLYFPYDILNFW